MGTNFSQQIAESLSSTINEAITEVVQSYDNTTTLSSHSNQTVDVDLSDAYLGKGCTFTVDQQASQFLSALAQSDQTVLNDLSNKLETTVKKQLEQTLTQANEGLNLLQTNVANVRTFSNTQLSSVIRNSLITSIKNTVKSESGSDQMIRFYAPRLQCEGATVTLGQTTVITALAQNFSKSVVSNIIKNEAVVDLAEEITQKVSQINKGLDFGLILIVILLVVLGVAAFLLKRLLSNPAVKIGLIIALIALLGLGGYLLYKRTRSDKDKAGIKK